MRSFLAPVLLLLALAAPARADLVLPWMKAVSHRLVLEGSERWAGWRIVAAPVHGSGGTHVVEAGVPFEFSTKYGTRLYAVAEAEAVPDELGEEWTAGHLAAEIPVTEVTSVDVVSPLKAVVTRLRIEALGEGRFELAVAARDVEWDGRVLAVMGAAAAAGVLGLVLALRRRRARSAD